MVYKIFPQCPSNVGLEFKNNESFIILNIFSNNNFKPRNTLHVENKKLSFNLIFEMPIKLIWIIFYNFYQKIISVMEIELLDMNPKNYIFEQC